MATLSSAARSRDTALQLAATVLAYSTCDIESVASGTELPERLEEALHDLVHEFCYHARKSIERHSLTGVAKTIIVHREPTVAEVASSPDAVVELTSESFWWVVNRIMHSLDFSVIKQVQAISTRTGGLTISRLDVGGPRLVAFSSDYDKGTQLHYVSLEALVLCFVRQIVPKFET